MTLRETVIPVALPACGGRAWFVTVLLVLRQPFSWLQAWFLTTRLRDVVAAAIAAADFTAEVPGWPT